MSLSSCRKFVIAAALSAATALATIALSTRAAEPAGPPVAPPPPATLPAASVVATINGKTVSFGELDKETQGVQMQAARQLPPEALAELLPRFRQQAMSNLVNRALLLQAVADKKLAVGDDEVKKVIDNIMKNVPPGETLDDALKHAGIAKQDFMQQINEQLLVQKLFVEITKGAAATDDEILKFYGDHVDQFKHEETATVRHILVLVPASDTPAQKAEKKKKAEGIRDRLVKGEDFAKVCAETSEDPGSKDKGGLYENFGRGKMVPPFENAAFTQKVGDIGPLVETSYGYHIIKVEKQTPAGVSPLAEVKEQLKAEIERPKKQEIAQKFVKGLNDAAKITYADGFAPPAPATAPAPAPAPAK